MPLTTAVRAALTLVLVSFTAASARAQEAPASPEVPAVDPGDPADPPTEAAPLPPPPQPPAAPAARPAPPPPAIQQVVPPPQYEPHLAALQVLAAGATPVIAFRLAMSADSQSGFWVAAVFTPVALGAAVCAIGNASQSYEGPCHAAIGGAFLGAVATIPLLYLGGQGGDLGTALVLGGVGWFFVQPAVSLLWWHGSKHPRPAPAVTTTFQHQPARLASPPGQILASVLALSF
jgi:hypothetical protein